MSLATVILQVNIDGFKNKRKTLIIHLVFGELYELHTVCIATVGQ